MNENKILKYNKTKSDNFYLNYQNIHDQTIYNYITTMGLGYIMIIDHNMIYIPYNYVQERWKNFTFHENEIINSLKVMDAFIEEYKTKQELFMNIKSYHINTELSSYRSYDKIFHVINYCIINYHWKSLDYISTFYPDTINLYFQYEQNYNLNDLYLQKMFSDSSSSFNESCTLIFRLYLDIKSDLPLEIINSSNFRLKVNLLVMLMNKYRPNYSVYRNTYDVKISGPQIRIKYEQNENICNNIDNILLKIKENEDLYEIVFDIIHHREIDSSNIFSLIVLLNDNYYTVIKN